MHCAQSIALRTFRQVKAYARFLDDNRVVWPCQFNDLPVVDKANYIQAYPLPDLLAEDAAADIFAIFGSSGPGGHAVYWPQLKAGYADAAPRLRAFLEHSFEIDRRRTLAIVGLALGSWIGGDILSWALKDVALSAPYPFAVFSPGNKHDEIIGMLSAASGLVDQFLLVCCPSAIAHVRLRADEMGRDLPLSKIRFLVIGEPFPESLRSELAQASGSGGPSVGLFSVYGSADTGILGYESAATVRLRQLCAADRLIAERLGIAGVIPHFFHQADPTVYLETVGGELCVTKWQGIPLVRYNLQDRAQLFDWPMLVERLGKQASDDGPLPEALATFRNVMPSLPCDGVIAVSGRSDSLILCGTKLSEAMLDQAVRSPEFAHRLTGLYQACIVVEDRRQRLSLRLETRGEGPHRDEALYDPLIQAIGRAQPEFMDDWRHIYRRWDGDPDKCILKLDFVAWPGLSGGLGHQTKQRGIIG
jgi:phenylacetate-CoA ligase